MSVKSVKSGQENFLTKPVSRKKLMTNVRVAMQKSFEWQSRRKNEGCSKTTSTKLDRREMGETGYDRRGHSQLDYRHPPRRLSVHVGHHKTDIPSKTETTNSFELTCLVQQSNTDKLLVARFY